MERIALHFLLFKIFDLSQKLFAVALRLSDANTADAPQFREGTGPGNSQLTQRLVRTILEPVLISFALGAAVCWFESSLPDHYREVGKLVKPAIISQVIFLLIPLKISLL